MSALHTQVITHYAACNDRGVGIVGENRVHVVVRIGQRKGIESEEKSNDSNHSFENF